MEIATLTAFISPFLSFLLKLGEKAAEKSPEVAVGKFGEVAWSKAQGVWEKLSPLEQDEGLVKAIAQILQEDAPDGTPGTQIVQTMTGNQNQPIGQVLGRMMTIAFLGEISWPQAGIGYLYTSQLAAVGFFIQLCLRRAVLSEYYLFSWPVSVIVGLILFGLLVTSNASFAEIPHTAEIVQVGSFGEGPRVFPVIKGGIQQGEARHYQGYGHNRCFKC